MLTIECRDRKCDILRRIGLKKVMGVLDKLDYDLTILPWNYIKENKIIRRLPKNNTVIMFKSLFRHNEVSIDTLVSNKFKLKDHVYRKYLHEINYRNVYTIEI